MDLKEIQNLIKFVSKSGVSEVKLEVEDFKITIKTMQQVPVASTPVAQAVPAEAAAVEEDSKYITITSPIIGTLYRKPSPDKPNFIEVGDTVQADSVVCIIEAMKLFNEIESEVSGKIVKVLVDDSSPVEFGQPLFLVDPS